MTDFSGTGGPNDSSALDRGLESFRELLMSHSPIENVLQGACVHIVEAVFAADMAGVMMIGPSGVLRTTAATDRRVVAVHDDQLRSNQGPIIDAARKRKAVRAHAFDAAKRWPRYTANSTEPDVRSSLAVPLDLGNAGHGVLSVYSYAQRGLSDTDEILVRVVATAAESGAHSTSRLETAEAELDGLREAMRTRGTIEQAKGILMANRGLDPEEAFEVLSLQSQNGNVKLSTIAQRIVDSVSPGTAGGTSDTTGDGHA